MWGMGRFVYWNVKYYLFCRKLCQSQREMWLPVGFSLLFYKITFCMSSLLFDCYLNGLSVCLVLVVNLLWQHLMFLLLLPNHLSYTSKVNAHSFFSPLSICFYWWLQVFLSLCRLLLGRANDTFRESTNGWIVIEKSDYLTQTWLKCHFWLSKVCLVSLSTAIVATWCD